MWSSTLKTLSGLLPSVLTALLLGVVANTATGETPPNASAGVETWTYPSGLWVRFKELPDAPTVRVSVVLPVGSALDPSGLGGVAHFLEHMMFWGNAGKSEAEFKREVESRGGSYQGVTGPYQTRYWVEVPASEWRFAFDWIKELVTEPDLSPEAVEEERKVVILEGMLSPNPLLRSRTVRRVDNAISDSRWARPRHYWESEFGLRVDFRSALGRYESLQDIGPGDLQVFYDTYYTPENMLVLIVGAVDRERAKTAVDAVFGDLRASGRRHSPIQSAHDPGRFRRHVHFAGLAVHRYDLTFKVYDMTASDFLFLLFLQKFLREYLNDELRVALKATYGAKVELERLGGHAMLRIHGAFADEHFAHARDVIRGLVEVLRLGEMDREGFEMLRTRVLAGSRNKSPTTEIFASWLRYTSEKEIFANVPSLVAFGESVSPAEVAEWLQTRFDSAHSVERIQHPLPASPFLVALLILIVMGSTHRFLRRRWTRPIDLTQLRYLRTARYSPLCLLGWVGAAALPLVLFGPRILFTYLHGPWILESCDSFLVHLASLAALSVLGVIAVLFVLSWSPRRILLFDRVWLVKFLVFRSKSYAYSDIRELRELHTIPFLLSWRPLFALSTWGSPVRKGIYIRVGRRFGYYFRTSDNQALLEQFQLRTACTAPDPQTGA